MNKTDYKQGLSFILNGGKLLISIMGRKQGEMFVQIAKSAGAKGGTILHGRGVAGNEIIHLLGLGDSKKDIILNLATTQEAESIITAVQSNKWIYKKVRGILFSVNVNNILRSISSLPNCMNKEEPIQELSMEQTSDFQLISVIVNAGYADDIMDVARAAGARGGTIIHARGTAKEEDATFFGVKIVPEKELILILSPHNQAQGILENIKVSPCLSEPGSGVAFCIDVEKFIYLGKR